VFPTFLAQYAAGCYLAVAVADILHSGWRYLRLMAIVSAALAVLAVVFLIREAGGLTAGLHLFAATWLVLGILFGFLWLFVNTAQAENVRRVQRLWPAVAGLSCLAAAVSLTIRAGASSTTDQLPLTVQHSIALSLSATLGAAMLGTATAGMLLGHRYLTDTQMQIAPLRRLTRIYLVIVAVRILWVAVGSLPVFSARFHPADVLYFWLALSVRVGVGLVVTAVFAWMIWDCVRRRATQPATALFYLSMLLVLIGELSGQYLMRTQSLPM